MRAVTTERFFSTREVARLLGVDLRTVQSWAQRGKLRAIRVGEEGRYREDLL